MQEKTAQLKTLQEEVITPAVKRLEFSTGEKLDTELTEKLASLDPDVLDVVKKLVETNQGESNMSLGGPSDMASKTAAMGDDGETDAIVG